MLDKESMITAKTTTQREFSYKESVLFINGKVLLLFKYEDNELLYAGLRDYLMCITGCKGSIEFLVDILKDHLETAECQVVFLKTCVEFMLPVAQFEPVLRILHAVMECEDGERIPFDWTQPNAADLYIEYLDTLQNSLQIACRKRDVKHKLHDPSDKTIEEERRSYFVYERFLGMIQSQRHSLKKGDPYYMNLLT